MSPGRRGRWFEGQAEESSISVTQEGSPVSVIIWWLNGSTQSRVWRGTQTAYWWWLVQKQTTDCSLMAADADIFIQLAQLTVIKENETLRLVCMGRRREKNQEEKPESQFSHLFWSTGGQFLRFYTNIRTENDTLIHTLPPHAHIDTLSGTHINISAEQKLHFLPSFTSCILNTIFQRKSLNVSSLLGAERSYLDYRLQAITKNWILSLIAVMCSASAKKPKDVNEEMEMRKMTCTATIFNVVKSLN